MYLTSKTRDRGAPITVLYPSNIWRCLVPISRNWGDYLSPKRVPEITAKSPRLRSGLEPKLNTNYTVYIIQCIVNAKLVHIRSVSDNSKVSIRASVELFELGVYVRQGFYFWAYGTPGVLTFGVFVAKAF